ncbi:DUF1572 domain-containing protein [Paenibacillus pasadenensis]|uniref:DUF1572 family protein n=1 Tax=Paenibacillus pasadenensis TaxID=217090 RepID=UPI00203E82B0|nr:DUF1572 family protein [Paenibacillus pasadenensis]MCM3748096.1 DUF1572 domain-containing protein [Paenibacillus pasadenensis]
MNGRVMKMEEIRELLIMKFDEIQKRIILVLDQLNDAEVNWYPNESSNSIANLVVHISGNVNERILNGIQKLEVTRHRDEEFKVLYKTKGELIQITRLSFKQIIETVKSMNKEDWFKMQLVRNKERTHLDVLFQCATHFSEHMGQIFILER